MTQKQTQVTVTGLAQSPSPYGNLPPGSLKVADNCVIRRKGVLSPLPGNATFKTITDDKFPVKMFSGDRFDYSFLIRKDQASEADTLDTLTSAGGTVTVTTVSRGATAFDLRFNAGETHNTFARDRFFFSEHSAPVVYDLDPDDNTLGTLRPAGLSPPAFIGLTISTAGSTDIPVITFENYCGYRAVLRRVAPSYELVSAPTASWCARSGTVSPAKIEVRVFFDPLIDSARAGDFIDVYKVAQAASLDELGDDFRLAFTHEITSADEAAGFISVFDPCPDEFRGRPLYTNSAQEGAASLNLMPPSSRDVVTHKDINWYASKNSWPAAAVLIPSLFGDLSGATASERQNGVGARTVTGDSTSGGHFITNVSAADIVGIKVGQILTDGGGSGFTLGSIVTGITGSGPYSIGISGAVAPNTVVGADFIINDSIEVRATKDGNTTTGTFAVSATVGSPGLIGLADDLFDLGASDDLWGIRLLLNGVYDAGATSVTGASFTVWSPIPGLWDYFDLKVTNGQNYSPSTPISSNFSVIESIQDTQLNRVFFSKSGLPEAIAATSYLNVGAGKILKLWPTQSSIFALCTDGLWRIAGDGTDWQVEQLDPTVQLLHADAVCSLDNQIFAWLTGGIAVIGDQGAQIISKEAIGPQLETYVDEFRANGVPDVWGPTMTGDNFRHEVWLNLNLPPRVFDDDLRPQEFFTSYIFNTDTGAFTTQSETQILCLAYNSFLLRTLTAEFPEDDTVNIFQPAEDTWCLPVVEFNPIIAGEMGLLKQWIDVNYFIDEVQLEESFIQGRVQASFDGQYVSQNRPVNAQTAKKVHYWVPRHCSLNEQLVLGFKTVFEDDGDTGTFNFNLYGFTVRFRVASETFRR